MADPITREQVEQLRDAALADPVLDLDQALPDWHARGPEYVREAWRRPGWSDFRAALTRWRDELAAAESVRLPGLQAAWVVAGDKARAANAAAIGKANAPQPEPAVRRVARWDAARGAYVALDAHGTVCMITPDRETAIGWGYEIEDGPGPVQAPKFDAASARALVMACNKPEPIQPAEDSPERLRERRRGVGWTLGDAARASGLAVSDVSALESGHAGNPYLSRYAAALSAEEERLAAKAADIGYVPTDREREPERPAHRFKGDLDPALRETARRMVAALRSGSFVPSGYIALPGAAEWRVSDHSPEADANWADQLEALLDEPASPPAPEVVPLDTSGPITIVAPAGLRLVVNGLVHAGSVYRPVDGDTVSVEAWTEAPERAPEVVDVPQPIVKRCGMVEATYYPHASEVVTVELDDVPDVIDVPIALLRAVLEAIDAQQGGA